MNVVIAVARRGAHRRRTADPALPLGFPINDQQWCDQLDMGTAKVRREREKSE